MSSTIKDIARLAGVSTATVSRVTNSSEKVSYKTRTKVLSAISRLQYRPNDNAAELGRRNDGVPNKREIHVAILASAASKPVSGSHADEQSDRRQAERLQLLEDENSRLRRLVTNLIVDLEMWRSIPR